MWSDDNFSARRKREESTRAAATIAAAKSAKALSSGGRGHDHGDAVAVAAAAQIGVVADGAHVSVLESVLDGGAAFALTPLCEALGADTRACADVVGAVRGDASACVSVDPCGLLHHIVF